MQAAVSIPIIHMIRETVAKLERVRPRTRKAGLLATSGTLQSGLYDRELAAAGIQVVIPDPAIQEGCVMTAVDKIKAGAKKSASAVLLSRAAADLERKGAEVIVLGCTETPLAFDPATTSALVIDASRTLAEAAIREFRTLAAKPHR
jgi:aspartate racemase